MKDMNFPIDMVWVDANQRVVSIESDVPPASYPKTFCPDEAAKYVLEFSAGTAAQQGLSVGQKLPFQTN
jgi:uncharacterized membrane protein (UPF0127 family)